MNKSHSPQANSDEPSGSTYADTGRGRAVFLLQASAKGPLADRLAEDFRVFALELRDCDRQSVTPAIRLKAGQLAISKYSLIADSDLTALAIEHAIGAGDSVESLILVAPKDASSGTGLPLEQVNVPTLVLVGTRESPLGSEAGRVYARRIPKCFYTLVYDAGQDMQVDRPQALYAVVRDFLEHREKFVIRHESSVINP
jgi:hypothetical protein